MFPGFVPRFRGGVLPAFMAVLWAAGGVGPRLVAAAEAVRGEADRGRLQRAVEWLAAPAREGRGPGTTGIDEAADWIADQFAAIGLEPAGPRAIPGGVAVAPDVFQRFEMTLDARLGPASENTAELVSSPGADGGGRTIRLELGKDFTPLAAGGSGAFDLPLVFAGYGITAPAEHYDDYAPLVVEGRSHAKGAAVVLLRQEPQKDNPHSVFDGNQSSQHAALARKVANASEHEVGGVVFCNDSDADGDALMAFTRAGDGSENRSFPVLQMRRGIIQEAIKAAMDKDLSEIQKRIDDTMAPESRPLSGWRIRGRTAIERTRTEGRNVMAVLRGTGGTEAVVLGAHYDHLGYGGAGSAAPGELAIHHGADDNASGTALLVEVARILAARGPFRRSVLFVAFSGEERGLLGSAHYTSQPVVPLADTVAMVNLDMVGRLDGGKVVVHGTGTGSGLDALVDRLTDAHGFETAKEPGGFGPSDHSSFYARKIPVLHLFTGSHADYHRPTDTAEKINYDGLVRIAALVSDVVCELASAPDRPAYVEVASKQFARGGGDRPYFGSIPDFGKPGKGYAVTGATKDSPASKGGIKGGDVIIRLGGSAISGLEDFDSALRKHKGGETVPVVVVRDGAEVTLQVTLGPPK